MNEQLHHEEDHQVDALLDGWREPEIRVAFTQDLVALLPEQEVEESARVAFFPRVFGPSAVMSAAAAILVLLVVALTHTSRMALKDDMVELDGYSDEAVSELYELIHLEELAGSEDLAPEDADLALLLFATGG